MDEPQEALTPLCALSWRDSLHAKRELDVLAKRQPGEEGGVLENDGALGPGPVHGHAARRDLAHGGSDEPGNHVNISTCRSRTARMQTNSPAETRSDTFLRAASLRSPYATVTSSSARSCPGETRSAALQP